MWNLPTYNINLQYDSEGEKQSHSWFVFKQKRHFEKKTVCFEETLWAAVWSEEPKQEFMQRQRKQQKDNEYVRRDEFGKQFVDTVIVQWHSFI